MCITTAVSEMRNTRIYVGEAVKDNHIVHVLAYQNTASSDGPNAMVLPFPTNYPMTPDNVVDTRKFPKFLKNISEATKKVYLNDRSLSFAIGCTASKSLAQVFDIGSYTVVLADKASQIPEALTRVPEKKRPQISTRFLIGFDSLYRGQPIAVCCWDGTIEAEPLMWWYQPSHPEMLFIPTMDAHDGQPPNLDSSVETDHIISVGSTLVEPTEGTLVFYRNNLPENVKSLLPRRVFGTKLSGLMKNGDCLVAVSDLKNGQPKLLRGDFSRLMTGWDE